MILIKNTLLLYGELAIKLKNNTMKDILLKRKFLNVLLQLFIWTICSVIITFLITVIIKILDFQWLYDISKSTYFEIKSIINGYNFPYLFTSIIWLIGLVIIIYRLIKTNYLYIEEIVSATNKLIDKNIEYVSMPPELGTIEQHLNHLKRESEKNEILARGAEQRKNDLIVYLAHDLKTPLTSLIGYLSLLNEIKDMPKNKREKYLQIVLDKSYKLEDLINELFDITRFNSETIIIEKEEINLKLMLEQIIDDFYPLLKENKKEIKLNIEEKIFIKADSNKLARVFSNIIKNAINYSTDKTITIDVLKKNNKITIITSNKGKEIPKEKIEKLFEKFYRADFSRTSKTGGSGLGLAIAKEIVKLHSGNITATSNNGYTKIYVELPIK